MCRSKISIHIDVRYKKSYTVEKVPEVAAGMKNKILVIEDDRAISELLCMNLEAAGYETVAAYDGEEAQRLLLWHENADLAVVDIVWRNRYEAVETDSISYAGNFIVCFDPGECIKHLCNRKTKPE